MSRRPPSRLPLKSLSVVALLTLAAAAPGRPGVTSEGSGNPSGSGGVVALQLPDGRTIVRTIPAESFSSLPPGLRAPAEAAPPSPSAKLHPWLAKELLARPSDQTEELVITFRDALRMPRFPQPAVRERPDSP